MKLIREAEFQIPLSLTIYWQRRAKTRIKFALNLQLILWIFLIKGNPSQCSFGTVKWWSPLNFYLWLKVRWCVSGFVEFRSNFDFLFDKVGSLLKCNKFDIFICFSEIFIDINFLNSWFILLRLSFLWIVLAWILLIHFLI